VRIVSPEIDEYLSSLVQVSPILEHVASEGTELNLPLIDTTTGRLLETVVLLTGARDVLEIGTANGYSALWMARSLPRDGRLISIELDPNRARLARKHLEEAGFSDRASVIIGDAALMVHKVAGPFNVIFNDGDTQQYPQLLDRLVSLLRPGGVLVTNNVLLTSEVFSESGTPSLQSLNGTEAVASYNKQLASDSRLVTSFLTIRNGVSISVRKPSGQ